ncbi:trafficking protein particle complex subunit 14 isoform X1 [Salarias fasciatus]|nr:microtubule-associated protein 11-like isoform X1 [Salarias fasciatus]
MEPPCEYSLCFPAAPVRDLSDAARLASLPRRRRVFLGESVQVLLVLRSRSPGGPGAPPPPWTGPAGSLSALASVCPAQDPDQDRDPDPDPDPDRDSEDSGEPAHGEPRFRACSPLLCQHCPAGGEPLRPGESVLLLDNQVIFCLTVSLDKLPVNTRRAKVVVTVWRQEEDRGQLMEQSYLTLLQLRSPTHTFHQDRSSFKTQVSTTLDVLPPPSVQCQQISVSGKHLTVLKVLNCSSQEEMFIRDVKILPNYNSSYLPMMPDGSVLIVDNVCHQSAEVTTASFCRLDTQCSCLPSMLSALEEQNFLFQLQLEDKVDEDSSEGLEVKLLAVLQWSAPTMPLTRYISTCYSLPSVCLARPRLVMTASCPRTVRPLQTFWVKYTVMNNLQDFLAVRLVWNSEGGLGDPGGPAVVCRSPLSNLGRCRKGSTLSVCVTFQILRQGLYELSRHMKMKLQFTACVSSAAMLPRSSRSSRSSPSPLSPPAVTELLEPSHSSFQQLTSDSHHFRSGSVMEDGECVPGPEQTGIPLGKIAKRECKVLVLDGAGETLSR